MEVEDHWVWTLHPSSCYTISSAYKNLSQVDFVNNQANSQCLCLKSVPLKVSIFFGRLLLNHIATKENLARR